MGMIQDAEIARAVMREMGRKGGLAAGETRRGLIPAERRREIARMGGLARQRRLREARQVKNPSH